MDTPEPDRHKAEAVSYQHLRCLPTTSMSPATPAVHSSKSSRKFGRCEEKVDLAGRANGHPILRAAEGDTSQLVTAYSLKEIMESVMVDHFTALCASAWVTHLHLSGNSGL